MKLVYLKSLFFIVIFITNITLSFSSDISIPEIKNKQAITVVVEKGHWTQYLKQKLAPSFTKLTQVPVNIIEVPLGTR